MRKSGESFLRGAFDLESVGGDGFYISGKQDPVEKEEIKRKKFHKELLIDLFIPIRNERWEIIPFFFKSLFFFFSIFVMQAGSAWRRC